MQRRHGAAIITALPTLFVYFAAGKYFVRGLTAQKIIHNLSHTAAHPGGSIFNAKPGSRFRANLLTGKRAP